MLRLLRHYTLPDWDTQVNRNTKFLCVFCGKPAVTTVFFDVPVCEDHRDAGEYVDDGCE